MTKPILESVAKSLIINEKNEALVLTIGEHTEVPAKSHTPDLPGGLVDPGETELVAVIREIKEETSIDVDPHKMHLVYTATEFFESLNKSVTKHMFIIRLNHTPDVRLSWEHASFKWVKLEDLHDVDFRMFYNTAIDYAITHHLI